MELIVRVKVDALRLTDKVLEELHAKRIPRLLNRLATCLSTYDYPEVMKSKRNVAKAVKAPKLSRTHAPDHMTPADWQRALRRQFGREQVFSLENLGTEMFFSEFRVGNPESKSNYRVAIRGTRPGENFCACPDYATNELGTCKHIEFALSRLERKRGAKAAFARGYQPAFSELYLRNDGGRTIHFRAGTDCPPRMAKAAAMLFDVSDGWRLPEARFDDLGRFLAGAAKTGHELRAYDDALDFVAGRSDASRRARTLADVFPRGAADPLLKRLLKVPLYPYQAEGALFAVRAGRALICDEMGLGKTIQAIAAAEILARHFGVSRVLVVCPTSLKYQWQSEILRFSGRTSRVIGGSVVHRQSEYAEEDFCKITNYEKLKSDLDIIAAWAPELVIVDEAQRIKNWNTIASKALKCIDSPYAVVLTGTPLENKVEELVSIVQFVDQHRLGPTWKLLHEHQVKDEAGRVTGYTRLEKINQTLAPIMIRRRKSEVLRQLPNRTDQNLLVPMTEMQMAYHAENADVVAKIVQRWRKTKFLSDQDQRRLTCALQNMRMSCNSTYLLDQETDHGVKAEELATLFECLFAQPEAKAVVFSQWTRTHEIVIRRLKKLGIGYISFHGGVPSEKRTALVERFRDDPDCRVFLSTDAGSTGLNLQHASTLVNMDLPWNPAVLEQRIARIHRMGQRKPVQIVNYVAKGTIEEGMLAVLAFKRSLSAGILDGGTGEISLGGSRLNRFMKDVENVTGRMGEGEAMAVVEEVVNVAVASDELNGATTGEANSGDAGTRPKAIAVETAPQDASPEPWSGLLQFGVELVSALGSSNDGAAASHPWVECDPATGARSLKLPLPPPDTVRRLADALSAISDVLLRKGIEDGSR
ncbi:DEAD/DEAH box helicase [Paraburkholderia sp. BL10I2N1]|uniref:DEAD/DEAH box helicase n=1 Tax=Paraburkholderia sp. BL10I2N1 TaxID=1938796 RepID=UPI0010DC897D|nr:DEAD/DEAH box helicase [Paraburkholderia sp. BL10I2N1]TDN69711.1 helicase-like protein [Paraburkholderia sp. BL10I2N1]